MSPEAVTRMPFASSAYKVPKQVTQISEAQDLKDNPEALPCKYSPAYTTKGRQLRAIMTVPIFVNPRDLRPANMEIEKSAPSNA